jgi:REP element-mobilizing transposase RayT
MGSTFLSLHFHIVFSTKERCPFLRETWRSKMHEYLGGTVRGLGGIPEAIAGVSDHVHLLVGLRATHCLADFMQEMKKATSVWAKDNHEPSFGWQEGYAAFTVSYTHIHAVKEYIRTQEEHHRATDFVEELKRLLEKNGVPYKPEYLV